MAEPLRSLESIERLISYDTASAHSNLALVDYVRALLDDCSVEAHVIHDDTSTKANLLATIGPPDRVGILLSGHTDVVPPGEGGWRFDPFKATRNEGRLYGRGAADMKGFLGVVLSYVPEMVRRGLPRPVHVALSYDEEIGCVGVRRLLPVLKALPVAPALCVVGEPTGMQVGVAHKGKSAWRVHVRGHSCHSSLAPRGVNAIEYAAELIVFIRGLAVRCAEEGPFRPEFDVPHSTLQSATIAGGLALNVVPDRCSFDFEIRNLPDQDAEPLFGQIRRFVRDELEPRMRRCARETAIDFEPLVSYPGLDDPPRWIVDFVRRAAGAGDPITVSFGTEGGLIQSIAGIPTVICGPGHIRHAHRPDEFVAFDQIVRCERFIEGLLHGLAGIDREWGNPVC